MGKNNMNPETNIILKAIHHPAAPENSRWQMSWGAVSAFGATELEALNEFLLLELMTS